jgi:hypothetical protein
MRCSCCDTSFYPARIKDEYGNFIGFELMCFKCRDDSKMKATEEVLLEESRRITTLDENNPDLFFVDNQLLAWKNEDSL